MPILDSEFKKKLVTAIKKPTKKQVIVAVLVIAVLITVITCASIFSNKLRKANVEKLELGDSLDSVIDRLGEPDDQIDNTYYWFKGADNLDELLEITLDGKSYTAVTADFRGAEGEEFLYSISYEKDGDTSVKEYSLIDGHSQYAKDEVIDNGDIAVDVRYSNGGFLKTYVYRVWSPIDTSKLGKQTLTVSLDRYSMEMYDFEVEVVEPSQITGDGDTVLITYIDGEDTYYSTMKKNGKLKLSSFSKRGHTVTISDSKGEEVAYGAKIKKNSQFTLQWTPNVYAVSFEVPEGYTNTFSPQQVTFGEDYQLPVLSVSNGFFEGWSNIEGSDSSLTDNKGKSKNPWDISTDTTMYAIVGDSCTVTLTSSISGVTLEGAGTYEYADTQTVTVKVTSDNDQYRFIGWYDGEELVSTYIQYTFDIDRRFASLKAVFIDARWSLSKTDDGNVTLTKFNNVADETSVTIPSNVTSIGYEAFRGCANLTSITIPDSVKSIGTRAFAGCANLTSVTIGDGVTSIGERAFYGCGNLESVTIPDSVKSIGYEAFYCCYDLTSVTIGDSVTSISRSAFEGCDSLTNITVSVDNNSYCSVDGVLYNKENTTLIYYPAGKTSESFTIPNTVTSISNYAFYKCDSLTSVTIPDSVKSIGELSFMYCYSLASITVSANNTQYSSKDGILYNKAQTVFVCIPKCLTGDVTIGDRVTSIGYEAFRGCANLTSITIPDSIKSIGEYAFYECDSLTSVTIGDGVTSIGERAFIGCGNLESVTIGDGVTSISNYAFEDCYSLTSVYMSDIASWCNIDFGNGGANPLSNGAKLYLNNQLVTELVIPNTVKNIKAYAFYDCDTLESVTIPDSVTSIGEYAFISCYNLTSITIGDSVASIGSSAFWDCSGLIVPSVYISDIEAWCNIDFGNGVANPLSNGARLYLNNQLVTELVIPNTVKNIKAYAFYDCDALESVTIPDSVTSIGNDAFMYCERLTNITVSADNKSYCSVDGVLYNKAKTTLIYCPKGKTSESFTIPDSVTSIGNNAFFRCDNLTSITISDCVKSIGERAFCDCDALESVTIPDSVTSIGNDAFTYCDSLTSITFSDTSTWYLTSSSSDWERKTGGTEVDVTDASTNATYFKSTYNYYYWYKL